MQLLVAVWRSFGAQAGGTMVSAPLPSRRRWTVNGFLSGAGAILDTFATFHDFVAVERHTRRRKIPTSSSSARCAEQDFQFLGDVGWLGTAALPDMVTSVRWHDSLTTQTLTYRAVHDRAGFAHAECSKAQRRGGGSYGAALRLHQRLTPVPEPESYAMFLAGLGVMGAIAARRRKSKNSA